VQHGLKVMFEQEQDVFFYIMAMNERYHQPAKPKDVEECIIKGMYLYKACDKSDLKVQLLGSGAILNEVIAAADLLQKDFNVSADIWSVTSFNELSREGIALQREHMFMPKKKPKMSYVEECLKDRKGPVIASTDYVRAYAEQIRPFLGVRSYTVLGTDGFGRSDTRDRLRHFFENDRHHIAVAALYALAKEGAVPMTQVTAAIKKYNIDTN